MNSKERFIADFAQKVFANVTYIPTDRKDEGFNPKRAVKYNQCACKTTKFDGKCMFNEKCKTEAIVYNVQWIPTGDTVVPRQARHSVIGTPRISGHGFSETQP